MLPPSHVYASLLGYIALGTCTAISLPQMWAHWKTKKADGISLTMLWVSGLVERILARFLLMSYWSLVVAHRLALPDLKKI